MWCILSSPYRSFEEQRSCRDIKGLCYMMHYPTQCSRTKEWKPAGNTKFYIILISGSEFNNMQLWSLIVFFTTVINTTSQNHSANWDYFYTDLKNLKIYIVLQTYSNTFFITKLNFITFLINVFKLMTCVRKASESSIDGYSFKAKKKHLRVMTQEFYKITVFIYLLSQHNYNSNSIPSFWCLYDYFKWSKLF